MAACRSNGTDQRLDFPEVRRRFARPNRPPRCLPWPLGRRRSECGEQLGFADPVPVQQLEEPLRCWVRSRPRGGRGGGGQAALLEADQQLDNGCLRRVGVLRILQCCRVDTLAGLTNDRNV